MISSIGQLFVFGFDGLQLSKPAHQLLCEYNAGGAILFKRNIDSLEQVVSLNSDIVKSQAHAKYDALISVDQEGGRVARLREICTVLPSMRELAHLSAQSRGNLIFRLAAALGRELSSLGFHLNFAPIADIDSNENNPIIGDRSFGKDPILVGKLCAEFIRGMQSSGVAACAKHFPGHGDTETDSHLELPVLRHDLQTLAQREFLPFEKCIEADVASIMTAHVLLPNIDSVPATLSKKILEGILRTQYSYQGLIISDDLEMKGIADHYALRDIIHKGIDAGVDLFLICSDTDLAKEAIVETQKMLTSRDIDPAKISRSLARIANFKQKYLGTVSIPDLEYAKNMVRAKPHTQLLEGLV